MEAFVPRCQLSLAYAKILLSTPETLRQAEELIDAAEESFRQRLDPLWRARAQLLLPSLLPRKGKRPQGIEILKELRSVFSEQGSIVDLAKVNYQLGLQFSIMGANVLDAHSLLQQALGIFRACGLTLWEAHCLGGLGILDTRRGHFRTANRNLSHAKNIFHAYQVQSLLSGNYNDAGRLALLSGKYPLALQKFEVAAEIYKNLKAALGELIAETNKAQTYASLGDFQGAIVRLEKTCEGLERLENPGRLADCRFYMARAWMQLGRYSEALEVLDSLLVTAPPELTALAFEAGLAKAYCLINTQHPEAYDFILQQMERWRDSQAKPDLPLLKQALGVLLFNQGQVEAETVLQSALSEFQTLGLAEEEASCQTLLGEIYASSNRQVEAIAAWRAALARVPAGVPELRIACLAGLGGIYEDLSDQAQALGCYREVSQIFAGLAPDFWQASLFSWYKAKLAPKLEKTLRFFCSQRLFGEALALIEDLKAHTFKHRLRWGDPWRSLESDKVKQLKNQIEATRKGIESGTRGADWLAGLAQTQAEQAKLGALAIELEQEYGRLQRQSSQGSRQFESRFDVRIFQQVATQHLGGAWVALDYYVTDQEIFVACITGDDFTLQARELSPRLQMALAVCGVSGAGAAPSSADLHLLARQLLPAELLAGLAGGVLIISAHQSLGALPWAGLPWQQGQLVDAFSLALAPSLEGLQLLWQRSRPQPTQRPLRLAFVGLSNFTGGLGSLPLVLDEHAALKAQAAIAVDALLNEQATHKAVAGTLQEAKADLLHLATHIHYEERSNYLCSIELADGPAWSEELFAAQPLPGWCSSRPAMAPAVFSLKAESKPALR